MSSELLIGGVLVTIVGLIRGSLALLGVKSRKLSGSGKTRVVYEEIIDVNGDIQKKRVPQYDELWYHGIFVSIGIILIMLSTTTNSVIN